MTQQENLEDQVKAYERELDAQKNALDQSSIVAITDARGVITYVNQLFCDISGYTREELIGQTHSLLNSGEHEKKFFQEMWKTISKGQVWKGEICNRTKDSSLYWVDTTIVPFLDKDKRPYQYVAIRSDISQRKAAERLVDEQRLRAAHSEKMASLGVMASGIAHELGNPLGALRGRIEMLAENPNATSTDIKNFCDKTIALVDRMNRIVKGLRAYARDGAADPFEKVSIKELCEDLLELMETKCRTRGIHLKFKTTGCQFFCDCRETEIGQVIVNLLNNAVDAVENLDNRWIELHLMDKGDKLVMHFTDSGEGLPEDLLRKIFDPFFTTKDPGKGTGLGLSISKKIILSHNGSFKVDSKSFNTKFVIELPAHQRV